MNLMPKEEMMKSIESVLNMDRLPSENPTELNSKKQSILTAQLISVLIDIRDILDKQEKEKPIHVDAYDVMPGTGKLP